MLTKISLNPIFQIYWDNFKKHSKGKYNLYLYEKLKKAKVQVKSTQSIHTLIL